VSRPWRSAVLRLAVVGLLCTPLRCVCGFPAAAQCESDSDCSEGAFCDIDRGYCVTLPESGQSPNADATSDAFVIDVDAAVSDGAGRDSASADLASADSASVDAALPDAGDDDAAIPDSALPDLAGFDVFGVDLLLPDTALPDTSAPDSLVADAAIPDTTGVDAAGIDSATPDSAQPDTLIPDSAQPDTLLTDSAGLDTILPDSAEPDTLLPDGSLPDNNLPDGNLPDTNLLDTSLPDGCTPPAGPTWWDLAYASRFPLNVAAAPAGYTVELRLADAVAAAVVGSSAASGADLRIVHHDGSPAEIDRDLITFTASLVIIRFKIQEGGGFGGGNQTYYLYIGNSSPAAAPANLHNVYLFFDDFEGFTAGDDGSGIYAQSPSTAWRIFDDGGNLVLRAYDGGRMLLNIVGHDRQGAAMEARMKYAAFLGTDFAGFMFWGEVLDRDTATSSMGSIHRTNGAAGISSWSGGGYSGMLESWSSCTPSTGVWYDIATRFVVPPSANFLLDGVEQGSVTSQPTTGQMIGFGCYNTDVYFDDLKVRMAQDPEPGVGLEAEEIPCQ